MALDPGFGVACATAVPPARRRHPFTDVQRASLALDGLLQELSTGVRSQRHYDQLESEAQAIAGVIVAAFRGSPRLVNPPAWTSPDGRRAIW